MKTGMRRLPALLLLAAASGLAACGSSSDVTAGPQPPAVGMNCTAYGDPPQKLTQSVDGAVSSSQVCLALGGEELGWTDPDGVPRAACAIVPANASAQSPLPMVVWLHPSLFTEDSVLMTNLAQRAATANVSGDPSHPGFILLLPRGRDTTHELPAPDNEGWGWDNWYRNLDRSSPSLNVDVAAIDHFVDVMKQRGIVDEKRVYVSGWSNGANMAMLYGWNTPGIAAVGIYSGTTPYVDPSDPCPQQPFATNRAPLYLVQHDCDIGGACQAATQDLAQLNHLIPQILTEHHIIDEVEMDVPQCDAFCSANNPGSLTVGVVNHSQWPLLKDDEMLGFFRDHSLR